jgi:hypothetical protein
MKAEHRKELETNALAERVGRVVQGMKQAPQKRTMLWMVVAGVLLLVILFFWRKGVQQAEDNSKYWMIFADGFGPTLQQLVKEEPGSNQAKAAEYEYSYVNLREMLRFLATEPKLVLANLDQIERSYRELAKLCKDDNVLLPEALFAQAVIEETRIIKDEDKWKAALAAYKEVVDKHGDSAFGKLAAKRVEVLENNEKRAELLNVYGGLRFEFVREDRLGPLLDPPLPPNHPPVAPNLPVPGGDVKP